MPNPSVPAAAEGVPAEVHARNRITELGFEISSLLDRVPMAAMLYVYPASSTYESKVWLSEHVGRGEEGVRSVALAGDPWAGAEFHARMLAKAMASWPESMRFSVTIHPHDAEQRLFWLSAPLPADETAALSACIDVHRAALKAFADVTETEGESYAAADEAESQAFANVLAFRCRWTESKEMKVRYLLGLLRQPCAPQLDADQLESLLTSVIG